VLSVEHTYNTYEINVGGGFDFELEMLCLVANWIYMVDYVFYGKCFGSLGALHTWLWLMEINVKRKGNDVQLLHVILTLPRSRHLHYTHACFGCSG
jgi:hypothetical protein